MSMNDFQNRSDRFFHDPWNGKFFSLNFHNFHFLIYHFELDNWDKCEFFGKSLEFAWRFLFSPNMLNLDDSIVEKRSLFLQLIKVHANIAKIICILVKSKENFRNNNHKPIKNLQIKFIFIFCNGVQINFTKSLE